jgi:hypothetical protein
MFEHKPSHTDQGASSAVEALQTSYPAWLYFCQLFNNNLISL